MVKVWIQRGENDPEKISISPDSDIDDLKTKVFGQINKGQYRAMYDGQILKPSDEVPQNTTDVTPVSFVKISNRTTSDFHTTNVSSPTYTYDKLRQKLDDNKIESYVDLSGMELTNEDIKTVNYGLLETNTKLAHLYLDNNQIKDRGIQYLSNVLQNNKILTELYLYNNQITDQGIQYLCNVLQNNKTLNWLNLGSNQITDQGIQYLSYLLQNNKTLTHLYLNNNQITDQGIRYLSYGLQNNKTLTWLSLDNNQITDQGIQCLCYVLRKNKTLTDLYLYNNPIGEKGRKLLEKVEEKNSNLEISL